MEGRRDKGYWTDRTEGRSKNNTGEGLMGLVGVLLILVRGGVSKEGKGTVFATLGVLRGGLPSSPVVSSVPLVSLSGAGLIAQKPYSKR
jgi:hypothetical protein